LGSIAPPGIIGAVIATAAASWPVPVIPVVFGEELIFKGAQRALDPFQRASTAIEFAPFRR
jgi:hypothetical protein